MATSAPCRTASSRAAGYSSGGRVGIDPPAVESKPARTGLGGWPKRFQIGDAVGLRCASSAPCTSPRAAPGRAPRVRRSAAARSGASITFSTSASTTGSHDAHDVVAAVLFGGRRPSSNRAARCRAESRSGNSHPSSCRSRSCRITCWYCDGSTVRTRGIDAEAAQVLHVGQRDALEGRVVEQELEAHRLARRRRPACGPSPSSLPACRHRSARLQAVAVVAGAVGDGEREGLGEELGRAACRGTVRGAPARRRRAGRRRRGR